MNDICIQWMDSNYKIWHHNDDRKLIFPGLIGTKDLCKLFMKYFFYNLFFLYFIIDRLY